MNIVITGVNGFVGQHLTKEITNEGHTVIGVGQDSAPAESIAGSLTGYYMADLTKNWPEIGMSCDAIIHLAGLAAVGPSYDSPQVYINLNSAMVTNMCEYYLKQDKKPRIVLISSGAIYDPTQPMPINENSQVSFSSPYAVSKVLNEHQAVYYNSRGLECVVMRPFNHIGPGQMPGFIVPDLTKKLIERGATDTPMLVGNLETRRDYTDVRDVVKAYRLVATSDDKPKELVYNVCSGKSMSGQDVLTAAAAALEQPTPETTVDESLIRPNDIPDIRGDSTRIQTEFGWKPEYSFEQSVYDFVKTSNR